MIEMEQDYTPVKKEMTRRMVDLYCRDMHGTDGICPACYKRMMDTYKRLDACKFKDKGWPCDTCPGMCYSGDSLDFMQDVMEHAKRWMAAHPEEAAKMMPPKDVTPGQGA
ncbi:MAG: nitrous oxide-stimulated promoter [Thermoplasmata archaeon]|nr:nitrous oxide-stimulated promoter [Thermoplasmata archaeon]